MSGYVTIIYTSFKLDEQAMLTPTLTKFITHVLCHIKKNVSFQLTNSPCSVSVLY